MASIPKRKKKETDKFYLLKVKSLRNVCWWECWVCPHTHIRREYMDSLLSLSSHDSFCLVEIPKCYLWIYPHFQMFTSFETDSEYLRGGYNISKPLFSQFLSLHSELGAWIKMTKIHGQDFERNQDASWVPLPPLIQ